MLHREGTGLGHRASCFQRGCWCVVLVNVAGTQRCGVVSPHAALAVPRHDIGGEPRRSAWCHANPHESRVSSRSCRIRPTATPDHFAARSRNTLKSLVAARRDNSFTCLRRRGKAGLQTRHATCSTTWSIDQPFVDFRRFHVQKNQSLYRCFDRTRWNDGDERAARLRSTAT